VLPGPRAALFDGAEMRALRPPEARHAFGGGKPVIVCHASVTARRLDLPPPPRSIDLLDALELFAFVRPATFCAPSPAGLAQALGLPEPKGVAAQAQTLRAAAAELLRELAQAPKPSREEALALAETMSRQLWAWAPYALAALQSQPIDRPWRGSGLEVWSRLSEWEDSAPTGEPGSKPVDADDSQQRLADLLASPSSPPRSPLPSRRAIVKASRA
jgi:ATP-dependent DNA helicase DinG